MKKIVAIIVFLAFSFNSFSQHFTDTVELNQYIRDTIKDRRPDKINAAQVQKALFGLSQFLGTSVTNVSHLYASQTLNYNGTKYLHYNSIGDLLDSVDIPHTEIYPTNIRQRDTLTGAVVLEGGRVDTLTVSDDSTKLHASYMSGAEEDIVIIDNRYYYHPGTGLSALGDPGWGLLKINDSAYRADTAWIASVARLMNELSLKQNTITTGTTSQYFRGDLSLATFPTIPAQFNPIDSPGVVHGGTYPNIWFKTDGLVDSQYYWKRNGNAINEGDFIGVTNNKTLKFKTGSPILERMRIDSLGNVGIGTPTPLSRLHFSDNYVTYNTGVNYGIISDVLGAGDAGGNSSVRGYEHSVNTSGGNAIAGIIGFNSNVSHSGSASNAGATGFNSIVRSTGTGTISSGASYSGIAQLTNTGNITNFKTFNAVRPTITSTGVITNLYALYIDSAKIAGVTNGYSIYQLSSLDKNVLVGNSGFGEFPVSIPTAYIHIAGTTGSVNKGQLKFGNSTGIQVTPEIGLMNFKDGLFYGDSSNSIRDTFEMRGNANRKFAPLINNYSDSLKRSSDSVYRRVRGNWYFQYRDSTGAAGSSRPSLTTSSIIAIGSPTNGDQAYNTDEGETWTYSTDWGWEGQSISYKRKYGFEYMNDLTARLNGTEGNISSLVTGGVIADAAAPASNRPGLNTLSTSTSATGLAGIISSTSGYQSFLLGGGRLLYETVVRIPTLSTGSERFAFIAGLTAGFGAVTQSRGCWFSYDEGGVGTGSAASANWQVATANSSTRSFTTTSVPVVAGQFYKLKIVVNAANTSVGFYIDDVLVKTETTNLPAAAVSYGNVIIKSIGTTATTADVDYIYVKQKFTTAR